MTTAPDTAQATLYGPDGRPLPRPATQPAGPAPRPGVPSGGWQPVTTNGNATVWEKTPAPAAVAPVAPSTVPQADLDAAQARVTELERRLAIEAAKDRRPEPAAPVVPAPAPTAAVAPAEAKKSWFDQHGPNIAMLAAVGMTASGEYALALQAHFPWFVAPLLPVAMDVYVIQAMRRHRDIAAALILAIAANALDRLATVHILGVDKTVSHGHAVYTASWWLILSVVSIAPFIVWRIHRITETKEDRRRMAQTDPVAVDRTEATDPVRSERTADRALDRSAEIPADRTAPAGPDRASSGPDPVDRTAVQPEEDTRSTSGPDRTAKPKADRTATPRARTADRPKRSTQATAPTAGGPDRTGEQPLTLNDVEQAAVDRLRAANRSISKRSIAEVVRGDLGQSIASDRAAEIARHYRTLRSA